MKSLDKKPRPRIRKPLPREEATVKSAGRVLEIFEYFDDVQKSATVTEVSETLGYPQSSTSALLRSLVSLGYLDYDRYARTYITSYRVALLGSWVSSEFVADGSIISLMKELGEETGDTIVLAMQNGLYVQYIHVVQATSAARLHVTLGTTRPLAGSGAGYAMLSTMNDNDVRRFVMRINAESKDDTPPIKLADVMEQVNSVRERGYAFTRDIVTRGGGMIAAPLPDSLSGPPLVIGIGGISEVMISRQEELAGVLTEKIAARFGRRSQQKYSAEEIEDPMVRAILRARRLSADAAAASR